MVKRKATESLDEWLHKGELAAAARRVSSEIAPEWDNTTVIPTAEKVQPQVATENPTVGPTDAGVTDDGASDWFWAILGQSGYELW